MIPLHHYTANAAHAVHAVHCIYCQRDVDPSHYLQCARPTGHIVYEGCLDCLERAAAALGVGSLRRAAVPLPLVLLLQRAKIALTLPVDAREIEAVCDGIDAALKG